MVSQLTVSWGWLISQLTRVGRSVSGRSVVVGRSSVVSQLRLIGQSVVGQLCLVGQSRQTVTQCVTEFPINLLVDPFLGPSVNY